MIPFCCERGPFPECLVGDSHWSRSGRSSTSSTSASINSSKKRVPFTRRQFLTPNSPNCRPHLQRQQQLDRMKYPLRYHTGKPIWKEEFFPSFKPVTTHMGGRDCVTVKFCEIWPKLSWLTTWVVEWSDHPHCCCVDGLLGTPTTTATVAACGGDDGDRAGVVQTVSINEWDGKKCRFSLNEWSNGKWSERG